MARTYKRDSRGRFAGGGGGSGARSGRSGKGDTGLGRALQNRQRGLTVQQTATSATSSKALKKARRSESTARKARGVYLDRADAVLTKAGRGGRPASGSRTASKATSKASKSAAAKKPKARGIEARLERSSQVKLGYDRRAQYAGQSGTRQMTPERLQHMGRRKQQQKQAIANLYGRLSPANQKRAMTKLKRSGIMNG